MLTIENGILKDYTEDDIPATELTIPDGVREIADHALWHGNALRHISFSGTVAVIGDSACMWLSALQSVSISGNVRVIGKRAFSSAKSLETVSIAQGVQFIGEDAFECCENLTEIAIPSTVKTIGGDAFRGCTQLHSLILADGVQEIEHGAFLRCVSLETVHIPASVRTIGEAAFAGCSALKAITVDKNNPFFASVDGLLYDKECRKLLCCPCRKTQVTLPESLEVIGGFAFAWCSQLENLQMPEHLQKIERCAFRDTRKLMQLYLPEQVQTEGFPEFYRDTCIVVPGKSGEMAFFPHEGDGQAATFVLRRDYSLQMNHAAKYSLVLRMYFAGIDGADTYVKKNFAKIFRSLIDGEKLDDIRKILDKGEMVTKRNIRRFLDYAQEQGQEEVLALLTAYQQKLNEA